MTAQPSGIGVRPEGGSHDAPPGVESQSSPSGIDRTVIVWLRRDLRLEDNPALVAAARTASTVVRWILPAISLQLTRAVAEYFPPLRAWGSLRPDLHVNGVPS